MSTQHTPGPWEIVSDHKSPRIESDHGEFVCVASVDATGFVGLRFPSGGADGPDARLIAAAPDMYEALKHEAEWHEAQARTHKTLAQRNPGMVYDGLKEAWHRERAATLRAVLVKAEGKS